MQNPWPAPTDSPPSRSPSPLHPALLRVADPSVRPSTIHGPDVFFMPPNAPAPTIPLNPDGLRRVRTVPTPHPYAAVPPIPPKPPLDTRPSRRGSEPSQMHPHFSPTTEPPHLPLPPAPPFPDPLLRHDASKTPPEPLRVELEDDDAELAELAAVIALSQAETLRREKLERKEEAELAAAMKASLSSSSVHTTQVGSSSDMLVSSMDSESPSDALYMDDETFARMLAAQDTPTQPSFPVNGDASDSGADAPMLSLPLPPTNGRTSMSPDEEFALRLAAEEGRLAREGEDLASAEPPDLPAYTKPASPRTEKLEVPELPRLQSAGAELTWVDKTLESPIQPTRPASMDATTFRSSVGLLSPSKDVRPSTASEDLEQRSLSANQYLDADLLRGVSIGFIAPSITAELLPMQGSMPNVVSLPYGRCPPLHLQAPSWRHLLKLMARLSGTRFEPTVEALAVARTSQMRLRTVVQFIRLHPTSDDWRTVLWFTTDHPVPASMPNSRKYTSNDVDVLPWSYTLSSLPALLRDSSDTVLSKCYTIPGTPRVPYPALPITFPDMVLYLQAALDESRHAAGDRDGGLRKLSKMMDTCYPSVSELGEDDRGRINKLFKKFQGGKKDKGRKGKGGGNEDTYELVTPFVLDDWGH